MLLTDDYAKYVQAENKQLSRVPPKSSSIGVKVMGGSSRQKLEGFCGPLPAALERGLRSSVVVSLRMPSTKTLSRTEYGRYSRKFGAPKVSKSWSLGKWGIGKRSALPGVKRMIIWHKSKLRDVPRASYRVRTDVERDLLTAEYQRLIDMQLQGRISDLERRKLQELETKLDKFDLEEADNLEALREYKRDIIRMNELIEIGERLKRLL